MLFCVVCFLLVCCVVVCVAVRCGVCVDLSQTPSVGPTPLRRPPGVSSFFRLPPPFSLFVSHCVLVVFEKTVWA